MATIVGGNPPFFTFCSAQNLVHNLDSYARPLTALVPEDPFPLKALPAISSANLFGGGRLCAQHFDKLKLL